MTGVKCMYCGYTESKVIDSRPTEEGEKIRRRRECLRCGRRFTTYEVVETLPLVVVKKDRSREPFDRNKLLSGMIRACQKRPVSLERMEKVVDDIEAQLQNALEREVSSDKIGEMALAALREIDDVAYVRFASVYRQFSSVQSFMDELAELMSCKQPEAGETAPAVE